MCESQASCNVLLCGKMSRTENIFTERGRAHVTSHARDLALLTSLDAAFLTSLAFLVAGVYFEQWMPRPSVTVLASTRLVERIRFCESTSTVVRDENLLRG